MTAGTDSKTIDGMGMARINALIKKMRDLSYQPNPAKLNACRNKEEWLKRNPFDISKEEKEGFITEIRKLRCDLKSIPYSKPMDDSYKRISYVRYADDFLIGVIGSKADAEQVKQDIGYFIREKLHLEISGEKTLIMFSVKEADRNDSIYSPMENNG